MQSPIQNYKHASYPEGNITQFFGENPDLYRRFGFIGHTGLDIVAPHGTPIQCVESGTVIDVKNDPEGFGKHVRIMSDKEYDGARHEWGYAHLSAIHVVVGDRVQAGETIGLMGNTGFVVSGATPFWAFNPFAGTHLHLQCRKIKLDETGWRYNAKTPRLTVLDYQNGYKGCFDIAPFFRSSTGRKQKLLTIISLQNQVVSLLKALLSRRG